MSIIPAIRRVYGKVISTIGLSAFKLVRQHIDIKFVNTPQSFNRTITICWHQDLYLFLIAHLELHHWTHPPHIWFVHNDFVTEPMHELLRSRGVKLVMGSAGHGGREASEVVVQHLQSQKYRSFINPDGPHGPSYQLKRGVLFMSSQANAPIIPVRFKCSHEIQLKWLFWDNKRVPLWRAQLQVEYGSPMVIPPNVDKLESEPYRMLLTRFLNGDDVAW